MRRLFLLFSIINCALSVTVKITFVYGKDQRKAYTNSDFHTILSDEHFDRRKPTTIYSYGFLESPQSSSVLKVADAYLKNGNYNFMILDVDTLHYNFFFAEEISNKITKSLLKIFEDNYSNFHLVGFSFGAQLWGIVGRKIIENSGNKFKIPRITGLDPGQLPPFANTKELNMNDAEFVDTIHVETQFYGSATATGNTNFWVNGGKSQPMCKNFVELITATCSHLMAPKYWAESVQSTEKVFSSVNYLDSLLKNTMGLYTNLQLSGNFYVETNLSPPYSKG